MITDGQISSGGFEDGNPEGGNRVMVEKASFHSPLAAQIFVLAASGCLYIVGGAVRDFLLAGGR